MNAGFLATPFFPVGSGEPFPLASTEENCYQRAVKVLFSLESGDLSVKPSPLSLPLSLRQRRTTSGPHQVSFFSEIAKESVGRSLLLPGR